MRMTAVKAVLRTEDQKSLRKTEDDGKARRDMASGAIFVIGQFSAFRFSFFVLVVSKGCKPGVGITPGSR